MVRVDDTCPTHHSHIAEQHVTDTNCHRLYLFQEKSRPVCAKKESVLIFWY